MSVEIENIYKRLVELENRLENLTIEGGDMVMVTKTASGFVIDALGEEGEEAASQELNPFGEPHFQISYAQESDELGAVTVSPGLCNGMLPSNLSTFKGEVDLNPINGEQIKDVYVYLQLRYDGTGVAPAQIISVDKYEPEEFELALHKDALPDSLKILIGYVSNKNVTQLLSKNLKVFPTIVHQDIINGNLGNTYYSFDVSTYD